MIAVFRVRCNLSIIPFVLRWYAVVRSLLDPIIVDRSLNSSLSDWLPRSVTMCNGTPKREIHVFRKANTMVEAEVFRKGVASICLVAVSMHVSTYLAGDVYTPSYVVVGGSDPMMSIWTVSNLPDGKENSVVSVLVCLEILCCWHWSTPALTVNLPFAQVRILPSMSGRKYLDFIILVVGVCPGCEVLWNMSKILLCSGSGM